jgi:hypothetical protein
MSGIVLTIATSPSGVFRFDVLGCRDLRAALLFREPELAMKQIRTSHA